MDYLLHYTILFKSVLKLWRLLFQECLSVFKYIFSADLTPVDTTCSSVNKRYDNWKELWNAPIVLLILITNRCGVYRHTKFNYLYLPMWWQWNKNTQVLLHCKFCRPIQHTFILSLLGKQMGRSDKHLWNFF